MRILFVTNNYTPYSGGVVSSIDATLVALQKAGHQIQLVAPNFLGDAHNDQPWIKRVPSLIRFRFKQNYMAIPWRSHRFLSQLIAQFKPDIVHVHHPFLLGSLAAAIAKKSGIKTVFTYHSMYEAYAHYVPLPQMITKPFIKKMVLSFCKKVDQIIVPSRGIKDYLHLHGISNTSILPSGLRPVFLTQSFTPKEPKKSYQLLYVGRFTKEKNIPLLFEVMAQLPAEYHLTLVGYGAYTDYLQRYAYQRLKLSPAHVRFVIKPNQDRLIELYRLAHIFLFPSQTDTQGLVMAEAMACSMPVIAIYGPGQKDSIVQGINGYMVGDERQMRDTVRKGVHNQTKYIDLQKGALKTAQRFDPKIVITDLEKIYND